MAKVEKDGTKVISGEVAFVLYDTFGFPLELTEEMCEERSISIDKEGFEAAMEEQRERARASSKQTSSVISKNVYTELVDKITSKRGAALFRFNKRAYEDDPNFKL